MEHKPRMTITNLPEEMLLKIFTYLPFSAILKIKRVCKLWAQLTLHRSLWNTLPITFDGHFMTLEHFANHIVDHSETIRFLIFRRVKEYSQIQMVLGLCPNITKLHLIMCKVDERIIENIAKYSELKVLSFSNSYAFSNKEIELNFHYHPDLEDLILSHFGLTNANFNTLLDCRKLSHLFISKIPGLSKENIIRLVNVKKDTLKSLSVYGGYDDMVMFHVSQCPNIGTLKIIRCENLTDASLDCFKNMSKLKSLSLWNNNRFTTKKLVNLFSDESISSLMYVSFSKVKSLKMEVFGAMSRNCPLLTFVGIYCCPYISPNSHLGELGIKFPKAKVFLE